MSSTCKAQLTASTTKSSTTPTTPTTNLLSTRKAKWRCLSLRNAIWRNLWPPRKMVARTTCKKIHPRWSSKWTKVGNSSLTQSRKGKSMIAHWLTNPFKWNEWKLQALTWATCQKLWLVTADSLWEIRLSAIQTWSLPTEHKKTTGDREELEFLLSRCREPFKKNNECWLNET